MSSLQLGLPVHDNNMSSHGRILIKLHDMKSAVTPMGDFEIPSEEPRKLAFSADNNRIIINFSRNCDLIGTSCLNFQIISTLPPMSY